VETEEKPLEKMVRTGLLYDFYGGLLTDKQRQAMELYYLEDWSLAEIAAGVGVSRQAIYDLIHRGARTIEEYEQKLGLLDRFQKQQTVLAEIQQKIITMIAGQLPSDPKRQILTEIEQQINGLLENI
jgi:predicted DNA-binding protein YlxM (UPF0122 family)